MADFSSIGHRRDTGGSEVERIRDDTRRFVPERCGSIGIL
jgi:hypothetical protein